VAYTWPTGKRKGWDFFTFDFLDDPSTWPMVNSPIERTASRPAASSACRTTSG
jgi:hypothetical protein